MSSSLTPMWAPHSGMSTVREERAAAQSTKPNPRVTMVRRCSRTTSRIRTGALPARRGELRTTRSSPGRAGSRRVARESSASSTRETTTGPRRPHREMAPAATTGPTKKPTRAMPPSVDIARASWWRGKAPVR